jgi:sugar (pentulose or hexulose) kinase
MYLLGIDAGTSTIKCTVFNGSGTEVKSARRNVHLQLFPSGEVEQNPLEIWKAVRSVVVECIKKSRIPSEEIEAVGVTGQSGGMILIDNRGKPFKMISWRDLRATSLVKEWRRKGKEERFYAITGWPLWPQFASVQLAWFAKHDSSVLKRADIAFSCSDWICSRLTGEKKAVAPAWIGTIDTKRGAYSSELFQLCEIPEWEKLLPELTQSWEVYGELTRELASETGLRSGTPVVSAGYDVACSAAGGNGIAKGKAVCVLGTSGTNVVVCDEPVQDLSKNIVCAYHIVPSRWLAISETMSATANPDWFIAHFCGEEQRKASQLSKSTPAFCDAYLRKIPAGADRLVYHPYLTGETAPFIELNARASFFGITPFHNKMHFLRSIYEGVGYSIRHNFENLESVLHDTYDEIVLVGGGSHSKVWSQIISDILGKRVSLTRNSESGCTGAALSAAVATRRFTSFEEAAESFVHIKTTIQPNKRNTALYNQLFRVYTDLIAKYQSAWNGLGRLKEE